MTMEDQECEALLQQGFRLHQSGRLQDAATIYQRILSINAQHFEVLQLLATIHGQSGNHGAALALYDEAIKVNRWCANVFNNRGVALYALGRFDEAVSSFDEAIRIEPGIADVVYHRGNALKKLKRLSEALESYDEVIRIKSDHADAFVNRGIVLQELRRLDDALVSCDEAARLKPNFALAMVIRGNILHELERYVEALQSYDQAIRINPELPGAFNNRGNLLRDLKHFDLAMESFDRALQIKPDYADARWNKSHLLLQMGDFVGGWEGYESRLKRDVSKKFYLSGPQLPWRGQIDADERCILIQCEQGLGDSIQFARYVPMVERLVAKVVLVVQRPLVSIMATLSPSVVIVAQGDPIPEFDSHCPLMSLPYVFASTLSSLPNDIPYLSPDPEKTVRWREKLSRSEGLKVGLCWNGGFRPNQPDLWAVNEQRNVPLKTFAAFLQHREVDFFSLQKGDPAESEIRGREHEFWPEGNFFNYTEELHDFSDTAALIETLDLVIAVDTSTAHLAGALGKPVWLLNRYNTCWRWLEDREDSPWYPSLRLFRQDESRDWGPVLHRVSEELEQLVKT